MPSEIDVYRRENGLTIRYLAETLFSDALFPSQRGIRELLKNAVNGNKKNLLSQYSNSKSKFEHFVLFKMSDYGSGDESELDILLRQDKVLFYIEVKAFTDPNGADVKREIVRNYINLQHIVANSVNRQTRSPLFSQPVEKIITILLYSDKVYRHFNKASTSFDYMNNEYLYKMKEKYVSDLQPWNNSSYKFDSNAIPSYKDPYFEEKVTDIAKTIEHYFLTWNDVYNVISKFNKNIFYYKRFNQIMNEMKGKTDIFPKDGVYHNLKLI